MRTLVLAAALALLASPAFANDTAPDSDVIVTPEELMTLAEDPLPDGAVIDEYGETAVIEEMQTGGYGRYYRRGYACYFTNGSGKGYYGRHYTWTGAYWGGYRGCGGASCRFGGCFRHGWWGWTGFGWRYGWFGPRWGW